MQSLLGWRPFVPNSFLLLVASKTAPSSFLLASTPQVLNAMVWASGSVRSALALGCRFGWPRRHVRRDTPRALGSQSDRPIGPGAPSSVLVTSSKARSHYLASLLRSWRCEMRQAKRLKGLMRDPIFAKVAFRLKRQRRSDSRSARRWHAVGDMFSLVCRSCRYVQMFVLPLQTQEGI